MTVFYPLQRSFPPRRRTAQWVGKPRIKLAERLHEKLAAMGYESKIEVASIRPASGAWRTDFRLDVLRVEGSLEIKGPATSGCWMTRNLESWSTITDMLRYGFDVEISHLEVSLSADATPAQKAAAANYEQCEDCGLNTHKEEAACLHCGHTKAWAQPAPAESSPGDGMGGAPSPRKATRDDPIPHPTSTSKSAPSGSEPSAEVQP